MYWFLFGCMGSPCCEQALSSCREWGPVSSCHVQASLCGDSLFAKVWGLQWLWHMELVACGFSPNQGLNPCPLHWHVNSYPLCYQGSSIFLKINFIFLEQFKVMAKLSSKYRAPIYPCSLTRTICPVARVPTRVACLLQMMNLNGHTVITQSGFSSHPLYRVFQKAEVFNFRDIYIINHFWFHGSWKAALSKKSLW